MRKAAILALILAGVCLVSACGTTSDSVSTAEVSTASSAVTAAAAGSDEAAASVTTKAGASQSGGVQLTVPSATAQVPTVEITAISLTYSKEDPLTLDLEEKSGPFAAHVESSGYVGKECIQIYAEDNTLIEVSDVEINLDGLVNFYLTGKSAGESRLYIATADGTLVSEPVELLVRSEEVQQVVYYSAIGEYWHLSEECAKSDAPSVVYDRQGQEKSADQLNIKILQTTRGNVIGDKTPCPKCAAEESQEN